MPDINGIQLYQIKILNPSVKIMFLTGLDAVNEITSMYHDIKSTDILRKPIEPNLFVKAVNDKVLSGVAH
jgi:two-component SAPR family response regulator